MNIRPRLLIAGVAGFAALLLAAEIGFRLIVGDRLLYRADPDYEYFPQPNQSVMRLGVRLETNALGMRSPEFSSDKPAATLRVLVFGDSVVFGHTNISQPDLATSLLNRMRISDARVEALNISAPSWGPGNMLAWLDKHGTMNADMAIIVFSVHDILDDRDFSGPDPDVYPQTQPALALLDWVQRSFKSTPSPVIATPFADGDAGRSIPLLFARISSLASSSCVVIHATRSEVGARRDQANDIEALATAAGLRVVRDREHMEAATSYIDDIHLSVDGQKRLQAGPMTECLASASGT